MNETLLEGDKGLKRLQQTLPFLFEETEGNVGVPLRQRIINLMEKHMQQNEWEFVGDVANPQIKLRQATTKTAIERGRLEMLREGWEIFRNPEGKVTFVKGNDRIAEEVLHERLQAPRRFRRSGQ